MQFVKNETFNCFLIFLARSRAMGELGGSMMLSLVSIWPIYPRCILQDHLVYVGSRKDLKP